MSENGDDRRKVRREERERHGGQGASERLSVNSSKKHTASNAKKSAGQSNGFGTAVFFGRNLLALSLM